MYAIRSYYVTPLLFSRAAERAGFSPRAQSQALDTISPLLLPCVLLLKDQGACVLLALDLAQQEATVMLPQSGAGEQSMPLSALEAQYSGRTLFVIV